MKCRNPKCKTELPEGALFCHKCGRKQKNDRGKYEREDGRRQVTLDMGIKPDGSRYRKYFYGASIKEAEAKRDAFVAKIEGSTRPDRANVTVKEWFEEWLALYKSPKQRAYNTIKQYQYTFGTHYKRIESMLMIDITHNDLQRIATAAAGRSDSGIDKLRILTTQLFKRAVKNGIIASDPSEDLEYPTPSEDNARPHRALRQWEADLITNNYEAHRAGIWIMVMLYAGLRRGEMIALRWDDIDFEANILHVRQAAHIENNQPADGKTKSRAGVRDIPMPPVLSHALKKAWLASPPRAEGDKTPRYVCLSDKGKQLSASAFSRGFEGFRLVMEAGANGEPMVPQQGHRPRIPEEVKALRRAGEREEAEKLLNRLREEAEDKRVTFEITSHDLRHTYATFLYDAGVDVKTAQKYLGHSSTLMTMQLYTHLSEEQEDTSRVRLMDFFGTKAPVLDDIILTSKPKK